MSDETHAALAEAMAAHLTDRGTAVLSGQGPEAADRSALDAAARAHLDDVDPGYAEREGGKPPHDRIAAPDLKAAYDKAIEASQADPGNAAKAAKAAGLGEQYAAVRQAARIADGRALYGVQVHTPEGGE